jgi:two-component system phosphate regulon sensor histidine kinase PhoR
MAISNILSNAIKYSKSDNIDTLLTKEDKIVTIEIKDYGTGIEEKHLSRIFDRFYRVDKSRSRQNGGTGLGLSIVKNIVELHNWKIYVESKVGKGTTFKIVV